MAGGCGKATGSYERAARSCGTVAECPSRVTGGVGSDGRAVGICGTMTESYGRVKGSCGRAC